MKICLVKDTLSIFVMKLYTRSKKLKLSLMDCDAKRSSNNNPHHNKTFEIIFTEFFPR